MSKSIGEPLSLKEHWDESWRNVPLPRIHDGSVLGEYHNLFAGLLKQRGENLNLLEIGCAASGWLPYFHKYLCCNVFGVDYSPVGVEITKKNLELQGMSGEIVLGDILTEDHTFDREFDVVTSFGFIEHFRSPHLIIERMSHYLKNGGLFITGIPNLKGIFGRALRYFRSDLYEIHNPMDLDELQEQHEKAGLVPYCIPGYIGGVDLKMIASVIVLKTWPYPIVAGIATAVHYLNPIAYQLAHRLGNESLRRYLAPDILVVYTKL